MGEARFNYYKDDNERKKSHLQKLYNSSFTERQRQIINGECPNVRKNEVSTLIKKCETKGLETLAQEIYEQYDELITGKRTPEYTLKEARAILQANTPWDIEWDDS